MIARAPLKSNCHYIRNILPEPDSAHTLQKSLAEIIIIPRSSVRIRMQADQTWTLKVHVRIAWIMKTLK